MSYATLKGKEVFMNEFEKLILSLNDMSNSVLAMLFDNATNRSEEELLLRDKIMTILESRDSKLFEKYLDDDTSNKISRYFK